MNRQFFGRETIWWICGGFCLYLLAPLAWWHPILAFPFLLFIGVFSTVLTKKNFAAGLGLLFFELIIGGHGLLLHADLGVTVTLRHAVFLGFFTGYGLRIVARQEVLRYFHAGLAFCFFVAWLTISFILGGIQNGWMSSFDEYNSFFYFVLLIPILGHVWTHTEKRQVLIAVFGGILFLAGSTLFFGYAYDHVPGKIMQIPYKVYRDARMTEISLQVIQTPPAGFVQELMQPWLGQYPYWYRVFNPSQLFFLVGFCLYAAYAFLHGVDTSIRRHWVFVVAFIAGGLFVGMSRSLLLAALATIGVLFIAVLFSGRMVNPTKFAAATSAAVVGILVAGFSFIFIAVVPIPERPDLRDAAFFHTSAETTRQDAVTSRWTLLTPLHDAIVQSPIIGHGFGKSLTYQSSDPRIIDETDGGVYTTYRFEWGYQDLLLKFGVVGLLLYGFLLYRLFRHALRHWRTLPWLQLGLLGSVLAVCVTHIFTPYLNHPIGIGVILLAVLIIGEPRLQLEKAAQKEGNVVMTFPSASRVSVVTGVRE